MEPLDITLIFLPHLDIPDICHRCRICQRTAAVHMAYGKVFDKQRDCPQDEIFFIGYVIGKQVLQMLPVNLAAQAFRHNLHHLPKFIAFPGGAEHSGHNHKKILHGNGIKIRPQVYRDAGADGAFAGHPMKALLMDAPQKSRHQVFIDGNPILAAVLFQLLDGH